MARLPGFVIPDHPQHVIIRGNNREPIFLADEDYHFCLEKLKQACIKHECSLQKPIESDPVRSPQKL
ncbi:hypothetical protein [Methylophaga sp. UBA3991]|jgi:putative transposase|uniref:hypothetical protein n=1 Tax=Methylophaga sp. UBA3991 TaxID=1946890 RepID=UPI00259CAC6A|nr:hypothetical protein [Methylophaga sp. UBA3991]|tara:strand:+ start:2963 stop:3163 length:201 start_codon:yes stop_codon:yes gene_type:complete